MWNLPLLNIPVRTYVHPHIYSTHVLSFKYWNRVREIMKHRENLVPPPLRNLQSKSVFNFPMNYYMYVVNNVIVLWCERTNFFSCLKCIQGLEKVTWKLRERDTTAKIISTYLPLIRSAKTDSFYDHSTHVGSRFYQYYPCIYVLVEFHRAESITRTSNIKIKLICYGIGSAHTK